MIDPELSDDRPSLDSRTLRQFAGLWLIIFGGLSLWDAWIGEGSKALVFGVVALAVGLPGLVYPQAIRPIFVLLISLTAPIGLLVTRFVLGVLFFGLFTPIALVFKIVGRDALLRRRTDRSSFWVRRAADANVRRYFRQY